MAASKTMYRRLSIIGFALIVFCSAILCYNVVADAWNKDSGWLAAPFIVLLLVLWWGLEWNINEELRNGRHWTALLQPARLARLGLIAIATPLAVSQALPLFEPGPMTKQDVRDVLKESQSGAADANRKRMLRSFAGLWGEPGCESAFRFAVIPPSGISIIWERRPNGEPAWGATGTILSIDGNKLQSRGESPADQRGKAATFIFDDSGLVERMLWKDETRDVAAELVRCG